MRWFRRLIVVGLLLATWWAGWQFVGHNQQPVTVHYVLGEFAEVALWKAILSAFGCGAAIVALFALWSSARSGLVARRYRKALGGLEAEIHQLRNLPLAPDPDAPTRSASAVPRAGSASGRDA